MESQDRAIVRGRLKRYKLLGARIKNLELEKVYLQKDLERYSVPIAYYGVSVGGKGAEGSQVEKAAARREQIKSRIDSMEREIQSIEIEQQLLDNALNALDQDEREAVTALYIDGLTFTAACVKLCYSERTMRRRVTQALESLAVVL